MTIKFYYFCWERRLELFSVASLERMATENMKKDDNQYVCCLCDFTTSKKTNFETHLQTQKHIRVSQATLSNADATTKMIKCENCNKVYRDRTGLWRHKKNCTPATNSDKNNEKNSYKPEEEHSDKDLIMLLIKENSELKNMMMEVIKNGTNNTVNSHNVNSHNKSFNLQFFLNETCKDAMNIMDFVESIKLQLSDLENVGKLGYVEGISNIIVKNLKALDITERPVHCTDQKRETMYIRDEDKWEKDESYSKIKKAIKRVASKNQRLLPKFKEAHPDCGTYHSKYSDQYNKIIIESVGGSGDNDAEKEEKIIRNITRATTIDKGQ